MKSFKKFYRCLDVDNKAKESKRGYWRRDKRMRKRCDYGGLGQRQMGSEHKATQEVMTSGSGGFLIDAKEESH